MTSADIGLIGLAVMGQNLVLNMDDHGFTVAVYNRTTARTTEFLAGPAGGTRVIGTQSIEELVGALKSPRRIMLMVKAGRAVDLTIERLIPLLDAGDIIIDGGNSHFEDSTRRTRQLRNSGILFVGTGCRGVRRAPATVPRSCRVGIRPPGPGFGRSFRPSPPRWPTGPLAATGWVRTGPVTTRRWCTTASSTATCR